MDRVTETQPGYLTLPFCSDYRLWLRMYPNYACILNINIIHLLYCTIKVSIFNNPSHLTACNHSLIWSWFWHASSSSFQWSSEGPKGPAGPQGPGRPPRPRGARGWKGPPERSSCRNPLARGPNNLYAGDPKIVATLLHLFSLSAANLLDSSQLDYSCISAFRNVIY